MPAMMWRPDPLLEAESRCQASVLLHREAGKRCMSTSPKRSYINRDSYYAEITVHQRTGRKVPGVTAGEMWDEWKLLPNVKLGTGRWPIQAALDGYLQIYPLDTPDPVWKLVVLEVELELLRRVVAEKRHEEAVMAKLDGALDDLTEIVRSAIVPLQLRSATVPVSDEDDDL